ncbi:MAG TPA: class I poly(R)-hydroxyalkanoic acid synthase [Syntrophales bacterium]|jgi:polyhydroxyalkanoate synthase|nr:class I poly(R)-hydroxyalkanoic acid synthase [Syntrophales bacterium]HON22530.1 class I poly(R)-hydroxyalkanoic acid synthase [Syntrophales bacterium]HOU76777.1 class I poly(R)-hydroxyalkanoic acid synthase [Syntrophales bacterium]HPC31900.1 class I poly(R)-hydroxyalkanoic acid synthase [Syntrophales bacterium]HQG33562.1 class I poly(R)-hydroxyalkanoic acid synthase [Syntrophales bacterium]
MDPLDILPSFWKVHRSWLERSEELSERVIDLFRRLEEATREEFPHLLSSELPPEDKENAGEVFLEYMRKNAKLNRRFHAILDAWFQEIVVLSRDLNDRDRQRARFWIQQFLSAIAPPNFFWTNPTAIKKFLDSGGASLLQGMSQAWEDLARGDYLSRITDEQAFTVGENIAVTPGAVVFRNDLMELIQYEAVTETVFTLPMVLIPPWINKYYIFDLTPQTSLVRYLRDQGFTVFVISWKNPTEALREVTFADYMFTGASAAIETARQICRSPRVHAAGYCIGGTALAALMAWLNRGRRGKDHLPVADWTLFSTLVDFLEPGDLGVFISERSIATTEALMKMDGFLDARYLSWVFRILGSESLIWRNYVQNYLYGAAPPKSDMLFWNSDSTRLPEAMCSFYLREFYLHNKLAQKDVLTLGERPIDMGRVVQPLYTVGTRLDHICPWRGVFRTCRLVTGPRRFVLSSEGHITGIINPHTEGSRRTYRAGAVDTPEEPEVWLRRQEERRGSWWPDWISWLQQQDSTRRPAPALGNRKYPPRERAPGTYVHE